MTNKKLTEKKTGDVITAEDWDSLNQVLYEINRIIDLLPIIMRKNDTGSLYDISILSKMEQWVRRIRVRSKEQGVDIYLDSSNAKLGCYTSPWTDLCRAMNQGWQYVFWIEDYVPVGQSDQDFEDLVIRINQYGNQLTIDVWHGEHSFTLYIYFDNTLLCTIPSRSASKYQLAYIGTYTVTL